jgi:hypothetical protein
MIPQTHTMSEMLQEMAERLLVVLPPSSQAMHVALFFATAAWNESVGLAYARDGYRHVWEKMEADNPQLWNELKSHDADRMIDELVSYKKRHYPGDHRRILSCGIVDGKIRVEWLSPAAPGVDTQLEIRLYGLVRSGDRAAAIDHLRTTRNMSRQQAAQQVATIAAHLGIR